MAQWKGEEKDKEKGGKGEDGAISRRQKRKKEKRKERKCWFPWCRRTERVNGGLSNSGAGTGRKKSNAFLQEKKKGEGTDRILWLYAGGREEGEKRKIEFFRGRKGKMVLFQEDRTPQGYPRKSMCGLIALRERKFSIIFRLRRGEPQRGGRGVFVAHSGRRQGTKKGSVYIEREKGGEKAQIPCLPLLSKRQK